MTIRDLILQRYQTLYAFSKAIGWTPQRVNYIQKKEIKKMNLAKLKEICDFLELDLKNYL